MKFKTQGATSLAILTGEDDFDLREALSLLVLELNKQYKRLLEGDLTQLKNEYFNVLLGYETVRKYKIESNGEEIIGIIKGVSDEGKLLLKEDSGLKEYSLKELKFLFS